MRCNKARSLIQDFREDRLDGDTRAAMADHFGFCAGCRNRLAQLDQADRVLRRALEGLSPSDGFAGRVMEAVATQGIEPRARLAWMRPLLAAAAVLGVVGGIGFLVSNRGAFRSSSPVAEGREAPEPGAIVHERFAISEPFVAGDGRLERYAGPTSIRIVGEKNGVPELMVDAFPRETVKRGG